MTPLVYLLGPARNVARDGPGPPPGDMTLVLPLVLASLLLPLAIIVVVLVLVARQNWQREELLRTGVPKRARVVRLSPGGTTMTIGGQRYVAVSITVEVEGPAPYVSTFSQQIAEQQIPGIHPGMVVHVRVDPSNPKRFAFAGVGPQGGFGGSPPGYGAPMTAAAEPSSRSAMPLVIALVAAVGVLVAGGAVLLAFAR
jgi:hypothetical protein